MSLRSFLGWLRGDPPPRIAAKFDHLEKVVSHVSPRALRWATEAAETEDHWKENRWQREVDSTYSRLRRR